MTTLKTQLLPGLRAAVSRIREAEIPAERQELLQQLVSYLQAKLNQGLPPSLNFICTHNSRRSQFAQVWAHTAAACYGIPVLCYSGGVEVTACNERTVASLQRSGYRICAKGKGNPVYLITYAQVAYPVVAYSKLFDDEINNSSAFAAVMTCAEAEDNCPFIPGAETRIPLRYEDPKAYDNTDREQEMYDERSRQIAAEMFFVFSKLRFE